MNDTAIQIIKQNGTLGQSLYAINEAIKRSRTKEERGELAELAVAYTLIALNQQYPDFTKLYHSVLLRKPNSEWTNELDFIFITPYRIYVIETKSYYGDIQIGEDQRINVSYTSKGSVVKKTYDTLYQNQSHCKTLYEYLYPYINAPRQIRPLVALFSQGILHDNRTDKQKQQYPVLTIQKLFNHISEDLSTNLHKQAMPNVNFPKVVKEINKQNIQSKANMIEHINRIKGLEH